MKAIDKFDLSYDVKFSTYAVPMISGEIKRFLRDDLRVGFDIGRCRNSGDQFTDLLIRIKLRGEILLPELGLQRYGINRNAFLLHLQHGLIQNPVLP